MRAMRGCSREEKRLFLDAMLFEQKNLQPKHEDVFPCLHCMGGSGLVDSS